MIKKMLVLGCLLPGLGGCFWSDGHERHEGHHGAAVVHPEHAHGAGCGHVLRGGIWVVAD